jgi:hypothetical protein
MWRKTAALRDFDTAYDRSGSFTTEADEATPRSMSASPPERGHHLGSFPSPALGKCRHRILARLGIAVRRRVRSAMRHVASDAGPCATDEPIRIDPAPHPRPRRR